jgi:hypothetical protein
MEKNEDTKIIFKHININYISEGIMSILQSRPLMKLPSSGLSPSPLRVVLLLLTLLGL